MGGAWKSSPDLKKRKRPLVQLTADGRRSNDLEGVAHRRRTTRIEPDDSSARKHGRRSGREKNAEYAEAGQNDYVAGLEHRQIQLEAGAAVAFIVRESRLRLATVRCVGVGVEM